MADWLKKAIPVDGATPSWLGRARSLEPSPEDYVQPEPPPGVIIHGADGKSRVTGSDVYATRDPFATERESAVAMEALKMRAEGGDMRALTPVMQGVSMGAGDEAVSAASGLVNAVRGGSFQDAYEIGQAFQRQALDQRREEAPIASTLSELAPAVMTGTALARGGLTLAGRGSSMLGRVGLGAAEGAGYGAFYGAASGNDAQERAMGGIAGGLVGAGVGGAVPLFAELGKRGYQAVADALTANKTAKAAGFTKEAADVLVPAMQADGTLGPRGQANIARGGSEAMLADAGPNARTLLDTAIQRSGTGGIIAQDAVDARVGKAAEQIGQSLDNALGRPEGVTATRTAIREGSKAARGDAYKQAYAAAINYSDPRAMQMEEILRRRVPQGVIDEANALMRLEGAQSKHILARVADDGSVVFEQMPDVQQIDYITRALNQVAEAGDGAGALGGQTPKGRAYENLARDIRGTLRDLVPEYGAALDTAADPIRRSKAVELGSKILSSSLRRDQVAEQIQGMSQAELAALQQGIRSQIDDTLANVTRTVQDGDTTAREAIKALKDLSSRASREKIAMVLGDEKAAVLFKDLDEAATAFDLRAGVADNSRTFARTSMERRVAEASEPGPIRTLASGHPWQAGQKVVQALTGNTPADKLAREDKIYADIARILTSKANGSGPTLNALIDVVTKSGANKQTADRVARAILSASGPAGYLANVPLQPQLRGR